MSLERKRGFLRPEEDDMIQDAETWGLPDYTGDAAANAKETALNYDPSWMPNFETPEAEEPVELTEEQIEAIKQSAYQEGLAQGQEAGYQEGFEKGKEEGFTAGHQEGTEQGKQEGVEAGQSYIQEQVNHFMTLASQFAQPLELMNAQVEKQLVDMVLTMVKEVVHVEVQTNPQVILDTVRQSVEALPIAGHAITIKLNPEDLTIVQASYGEEELQNRSWTLSSEPSLNRGDVHIEAGESSVSFKMEERIRSVIQSFCGVNRHQEQL
ncbi:putative flagellar assembly protein H [Vibrio nigripulchritudo MADA3029]|uniref:flagellar assembly protein FliH n=1 Tax=Vibrio TaxID=662 RepID=UPI0003B18629|nr:MULTISPECIES: flagellar assembly protein FliH [Vibrio]KJY80223.1 flagellar assembly protein FliH [Vibrio nigripulchritudo]UAB71252.1 flagellar assembly protein FliH [Vibrio sp. SCSIO 43132]CCN36025.1 putative flagellar assembly protein H [Vibrio nigripulchritudo AM115]CCN44306.1 putative flagellar assembly protein H [Vibrio nigripulchritudo FTn2]CCN48757.1 putative flagellar assembly protein H [Vibrio nigripulchritudo MADA3020]